MKFPTKEELKKLREEFPSGCRIVLDEMDDVQAPIPGSQGTCRGVDDAGPMAPTHATVWLPRVRLRKASTGWAEADTGAHVAPGAAHMRKRGTASWRKAAGRTSRCARPVELRRRLRMQA